MPRAPRPNTAATSTSGSKELAARANLDAILKGLVALYTDNRRVTKLVAARARLTGPQLVVIKLLEQVGAMSLSELSEAMRSGNSTVTGIALRMEREALVRRERPDHDRRVVRLTLTPKGRRVAQEVPVEPIGIYRRALATLSADEARDLLTIMEKLTKAVRRIVDKELGPLPHGRSREDKEHSEAS